jgi:timeless
MTLQVLETNAKLCRTASNRSNNNTDDDAMKHDTVAKMKAMAIEFDIESYFVRKLVSNHTITMYTHLLSFYAINTPEINQYIVSFLERVRQHILSLPSEDMGADDDGDDDDDLVMKNPFTSKTVTMEPMLYNAQLFIVLNNILNDTTIRSDPAFIGIIDFATSLVHNFAVAAQSNPVLFVEILFKHPSPHRFCDMITNSYVTEDLRMLVERDILLQQQYQLEQEVEALTNHHDDDVGEEVTARSTEASNHPNDHSRDNDNNESSDEELEFTDVPLDEGPILGKKRHAPKVGAEASTEDDDDDDNVSKRVRTKYVLSDSDDE